MSTFASDIFPIRTEFESQGGLESLQFRILVLGFKLCLEQSRLTLTSSRFAKGIPSKLEYTENGKKKTVTDSVELFLAANAIAKRNGVGRVDIVC